MEKIKALSSEVVDQIAAGEVVERPAHLVKELVENAVDAGASVIEIEYDQGGRRVRVTDDGSGIASEELILALSRHATSKITKADDLWNLSTFGFRGEALASLAAVSRLRLQSRTADSKTAFEVVSEFGKILEPEPSGGNFGTTVVVEDLFANIPARLKFLKTEAGEHAQIKATLKALALANEGVEFRIRTKGKLEQVWKKTPSFLVRASQILEQESLFESEFEYQGFRAHVVFASPHEVSGNARNILLFVQGRWVQDRSLQAAVIEAYRGLLMHGEYPCAVVRLKAPLDEIDVNIHPTKSQVKFRDPQPAFRAVNRALRAGLETAPWLVNAFLNPVAGAGQPELRAPIQNSNRVQTAVETFSKKNKYTASDFTRPYKSANAKPSWNPLGASTYESALSQNPSFENSPVHSVARFESPEFNTVQFQKKTDVNHALTEREKTPDACLRQTQASPTGGAWSRLQVLGQAHLTYILAQDQDRLVLIDQHAAHERVAYERLMKAWLSGEIEVQPLLLPITLELEPDGAEALVRVAAELEKLGVQLDQNGPQSVAIRSVPVLVKESAISQSLQRLAREIVERGGSFAFENKISDLCATMACHSVVRAGQALSVEQMKSLLSQMDEFALSSFCPHGRPVSVDYPFNKLERDFGRIT